MVDDMPMQCAATVMDTFHTMMQTVGSEARKRSSGELSMQQFRAMKTVEHHAGASLSLVAEHLGATISAASKLMDGLVDRGFICRSTAEDDRRRLILALTQDGEQALASIHLEIISCLAERLSQLSQTECAMLDLAMDILRSALVPTAGQSTIRSEQRV